MSEIVERRKETIICPNCDHVQEAEVIEVIPWVIYIHQCEECDYLIMESEWARVSQTEVVASCAN